MNIHFTKMQGLGNDFIVLDATKRSFDLSGAQIQQMANRRFGVGFDQLLLLEPASQSDVDFHFRIFNADGTEVEQCGNGARCMARFIQEKGLSDKRSLRLSVGNKRLSLKIQADGKIAVDMGIPKFEPKNIPFLGQSSSRQTYQLSLNGKVVLFGVVNIGNPHAIIEVPKIQAEQVAQWGEALSRQADFPEGVNVGFMQVIDTQNIRLRCYERGSGETLACGSNACAAVAVGRRGGRLQERVMVSQPGGSLMVDWQGPRQPVIMTGPAETVFEGAWIT